MELNLFEFEDKAWLPPTIRKGMLDYLAFTLNRGNFYEPVAPLIVQLMQQTNAGSIIDLCSGGGGTIEQLQKTIYEKYQLQIPFVLTDIFPDEDAYKLIQYKTGGKVTYYSLPVNAVQVPGILKGTRTIFSAFHHFNKSTAVQVIKNAVAAKEGIGVFDGGNKNLFFMAIITMLHPIGFIFFTPFLRPFKWSRLLFTYIIPIIPLCTMWDGIVSIIHLYQPQQLLKIATIADDKNYKWQTGKVKNKYGMHITYLLGYPK